MNRWGMGFETITKEAYQLTVSRLDRLPILIAQIDDDREDLALLESGEADVLGSYHEFLGKKRGGRPQSPQEIRINQMADIRKRLAKNEYEVARMRKAMSFISADPYYCVIEGRYLRYESEIELAEQLNCDESTVRRNRNRLITRLAARLYGRAEKADVSDQPL